MNLRPAPEVHFEPTSEWLLVRARGEYDIAWLKGFYRLIAATAQSAVPPARAVLVDARELTGGPLSDMDRYDLGVLVARELVSTPAALVGSLPFVDRRRFGESVARNRGANVRVFTDLDEAVAWLRNPGETPLREES